MSMSRRVAVPSCLVSIMALVMALGIVAPVSTAQAQPGMTGPAARQPAPTAQPGAPAQPAATAPAVPHGRAQPAGTPPATSGYPLPPPPNAGNAPMQPPGMLAPGAVPAGQQPRPAPRYETYHGLAFLGDLAWFWATYRLAEAESDLAPLVGLGGYVLTVPFIHAIKGNSRSAWISGGIRGAALGLTVVSVVSTIGCYDDCSGVGLAVTGVIGMGTIMVADWLVLSRKEIPQDTPARARGTQPGWTLLPQVQVGHESLHVGVGGAF